MRALRVAAGALLGLLGVLALWMTGLASPPDALSRRIAAFAAIYPGPVGEAQVQRIPCAPLGGLRLYLVCTEGCDGIWRIVAVRGLWGRTLADLGRLPPEPGGAARHRFNDAVARERLRLDAPAAREMAGCYLLLEGYHPELILPDGGPRAVAEARGEGEEAMRRLAESLDDPAALSRIDLKEIREGFEMRFFYWHTARQGRPVLEILLRMARDGELRLMRARQLPLTDGTASGSTPGTPPI